MKSESENWTGCQHSPSFPFLREGKQETEQGVSILPTDAAGEDSGGALLAPNIFSKFS